MRLIDADELMEKLKKVDCTTSQSKVVINNTIELIKYQPTAYDIDKVVGELQESASRYTKKYTTPYGDKGYKDVKAISVNKAIEIIKAGGKNE